MATVAAAPTSAQPARPRDDRRPADVSRYQDGTSAPGGPKANAAQSGLFARFAAWIATVAGRPIAFVGASVVVVLWALAGPVFGFSDTWQLVINTGTTVVTFLMVFVIQNAQNRDSIAIQIKLDELIRVTSEARNTLVGIERGDEEAMEALRSDMENACADK